MKPPKKILNQAEFPGVPLDAKGGPGMPKTDAPAEMKKKAKPMRPLMKHKVKMNPSKMMKPMPQPMMNPVMNK